MTSVNSEPYAFQSSGSEPIIPVSKPKKWDLEADFVVVGGGGSGLSAGAKLAMGKASVIILEKMDDFGGASQHSTNAHGTATKAVARAGLEFDENQLVAMTLSMDNFRPNERFFRYLTHKGSEVLDWMEDNGMEWDVSAEWGIPAHQPKGVFTRRWLRPQRETCEFLYKLAEKHGAKIILNAPAMTLVKDNGRIVGVKAMVDGKPTFVGGKKAVILAAGSMSQNRDMLKKYIPWAADDCASSYDMPGNTGDCIRMGQGVDADIAGFNSFCVFEAGLPYYEEGKGPWNVYLYRGDIQLARQAWMWINRACERFVNEYAVGPGYVTAAIAGMNQPGHDYFVVFDGNYEKDIYKFNLPFCKFPLSEKLAGMDVWEDDRWNCPRNWQDAVKEAFDLGMIKQSETLEGLANIIGLDPIKFKAEVEKYNGYCAKGEDPDFGKPGDFLFPIMKAPFYAIRVKAQIVVTHCGLRVDDEMHVLDTKYHVIPGLYAAYHTAGGDLGENIVGLNPLGEVALAYTSGYVAAEAALKEKSAW